MRIACRGSLLYKTFVNSQRKKTLSFCQAVDLNIDEDTLMKLAPFYRTSLAPSTGPSRLIYYERFEIHPIKVSLCLKLCFFYKGWVKYSLLSIYDFSKLLHVHIRSGRHTWLLQVFYSKTLLKVFHPKYFLTDTGKLHTRKSSSRLHFSAGNIASPSTHSDQGKSCTL